MHTSLDHLGGGEVFHLPARTPVQLNALEKRSDKIAYYCYCYCYHFCFLPFIRAIVSILLVIPIIW